jgi:HNH endonuclease
VLVDDERLAVAVGKRFSVVSPKFARAVLSRDGHCRIPGCERRHGLEVHHLRPRSWGGADEIANLAAVCPSHHRTLVPHGERALVGNPNQPDGLELVELGDLTAEQADRLGRPPPRAGPFAA